MLGNLVKRISTAPGGISVGGYQLVTRNSKYFAYASHYTIFIYSLPDFSLCDTLCQGFEKIKYIRLNPVNLSQLAVLYTNKKLELIDFIKRKILTFDKMENLFGGGFDLLEFTADGKEIRLFTVSPIDVVSMYVTLNIQNRSFDSHVFNSLPNIQCIVQHPELPNLCIAYYPSAILKVDFQSLSTDYKAVKGVIYTFRFDPLNSMNCLLISDDPKWALMTFMPNIKIISKANRDDIATKCGDWVTALPGHIVTGSAEHGIIHVWSVVNGNVVDFIDLEPSPVQTLIAITDRCVAAAFKDGIIGIVDVTQRAYVKRFPNAHTNTIFSCNFLPTDPNILSTAGADNKVCLWSVPKLEQKNRMNISADGCLTTCFSPGGGYMAAGSRKGYVTLFSLKSMSELYTVHLHKAAIFCVDWSPHDPNLIVSASEDNHCVIYNITNKASITTISVKTKFRKVKWSTKDQTIALACFDGSLYVRYDGGAYHIIKGCPAPLFDVAFSPHDNKIVAATDDQGGVSIYNIETQQFKRAKGHEGKARPIQWSYTIPYLCISGGYDGKIILWDSRDLSILGVIGAHASHIYGLASHPDHPYMFASSSRDETVRIWSFDRMFPAEKIQALLSGESFQAEKFCPYEGCTDLVKLMHRILKDGTRLTFNDDGLCHVNDVLRLTKKRISRMTSALPREQGTLMRAKKAKQSTIDAADLCLKSGDVKRYCELMFMAGEYDLALAAAPAVGYNFWQNLTLARAEMVKGTEEAADLTLIAGKPKDAIQLMIDMHQFDDAMLVTAALREKTFQPRTKTVSQKPIERENPPFIRNDFSNPEDYGPYIVASKRSKDFAKEGKPLLAAAALLTVGDVPGAAWRLLHCGELMWAIEVSRCAGQLDEQIAEVFARYCIENNCVKQIFPTLSPRLKRKLIPLVKFKTEEIREKFYSACGMKTLHEYLDEAKKARGLAKVQFLLLAGKIPEALQAGVQILRSMLSNSAYDYSEAKEVASILANVHIPKTAKDTYFVEVMAIVNYFAIYEAMWKGYDSIIEKLVVVTEEIINQENIDWLKPRIKEMKIAASLALAKETVRVGKAYIDTVKSITCKTFEGIQSLDDDVSVDGGCTVHGLGSGIIPFDIGIGIKKSICSGLRIHGNYFVLEDKKSMMTLDEALMWFEVTPYSPLPTAQRMFPY